MPTASKQLKHQTSRAYRARSANPARKNGPRVETYPGSAHETVLNKSQRKILLIALAIVNFVYFLSSSYIGNSNEGSHFALVSALVEDGTVEISNYLHYTERIDYATKDGKNYSDRLPGTAFLSIPFYTFGKFVRDSGLGATISHHANSAEVFVVLLPNLAATLAVFLMFRLCILMGFDFPVSVLTAMLFAFTTLLWREGSHFFSHAQSIAAISGAVYLAVSTKNFFDGYHGRLILIAAILALAAIIEQVNLLHVLAFFIYGVSSGKAVERNRIKQALPLWAKAGIVYLAIYSILVVYNYAAFGELTIRTAKYNPNFPESTIGDVLQGNPLRGADLLLTNFMVPQLIFDWTVGVGNATPGLFVISPILVLSLFGFYEFFKFHKHEALLFGLLIVIQVGIVSFNHNPQTRHILTILPFVFFPLAYVLKQSLIRMRNRRANIFYRYRLLGLIITASLYSAARAFYSINTFYGRSLSSPFTFANEIFSYLLFYGTIFLIYAAYRYRAGKFSLDSAC